MKKALLISLMLLALIIATAACTADEPSAETTGADTTAKVEEPTVPSTVAEDTTAAEEPTEAPTESTTNAPTEETTPAPETAKQPETTKAPETTKTPDDTEPPEVDPVEALAVNKTTFVVGEPILITAHGTGTDWIGIATRDGDASIGWYYVEPVAGQTVDYYDYAHDSNNTPTPILTAGEYTVYLIPDDHVLLGATPIAQIDIVIVEASALTDVALGAQVDVTSAFNAEFFNPTFLTDGIWEKLPTLGWCSQTMGGPTGEFYVTLSLDRACDIYEVILKPMMWDDGDPFPTDYELQFSLDGTTWETVLSVTDMNVTPEKPADAPEDWSANDHVQPVVHTLDAAVHAQYFRINILKHGRDVTEGFNDTPISQLGEIELIGLAS